MLREAGMERPYTSPLNDEHRTGTFTCAGCKQPLLSSKTKSTGLRYCMNGLAMTFTLAAGTAS